MSKSARTAAATSTFRVKLRKKNPAKQYRPLERAAERVPRVARLLALAHKVDAMIRSGELKNWADAARLIGVTRARMTHIANLLLLAPQIQDSILGLALVPIRDDSITEHHLRTIQPDWQEQERVWLLFSKLNGRT